MLKHTIIHFLFLLSVANAVLSPGYEDNMWCPPDSCEQSISHPDGFTGPRSIFQGCYNVTTETVDTGIWTGSLTKIVPPNGWVMDPEPCSSDLDTTTTTTSTTTFAPAPLSINLDPGIMCMCIFVNGTSCCPQEDNKEEKEATITSDPSFVPTTIINPSPPPTNAVTSTDTVKSSSTFAVVYTKKSCDDDSTRIIWCPETNSCIDPIYESCPVEGGVTFIGPLSFKCNGSGRCDASRCTMQNGGIYLTGLSGNQNIPQGCTMKCDNNCSIAQGRRLLNSSARSNLVDLGKYTVIVFFGVVIFAL